MRPATDRFRWLAVRTIGPVAVLFWGVACATSSAENTSRESTVESEQVAEADSSDGSGLASPRGERPERGGERAGPRVELETLIGAELDSGLPRGCPSEWTELKGRQFKGKLHACDGFAVEERFREPTVVIGVEEGKIRRVSLQAFYRSGEAVRRVYDAVASEYQQQCERTGGSGDRVVLDCEDFLVDISHREETGSLRMIYGLENWDMRH